LQDKTEILVKVALSTIILTLTLYCMKAWSCNEYISLEVFVSVPSLGKTLIYL
jgi:hypothetical protein